MLRPIGFVTPVALLLQGCASPRLAVPPGEDRSELAAQIIERGQGHGPQVEPLTGPEPVKTFHDKAVAVALVTGAVCLYVACIAPLVVLAGLGKGHLPALDPSNAAVSSSD
jgi:hypothetical protein